MKPFFWVAGLLIIAPVYAGEKDFPDFLKDYIEFRTKRDAAGASHTARFAGKLVFRESDCEAPFALTGFAPNNRTGGSDGQCDCPPGNNYLQCLVSAQAIIKADPNDYGGRGYVMVQTSDGSGVSVLNQHRQWVPITQFKAGSYSAIMEPVVTTNTINIPVPDSTVIERACFGISGLPGARGAKTLTLTVGYGAAMPMDIEFAKRMKGRSVELGQDFDEEAFVWSRARTNGFRPKKAGDIGTVSCPQLAGS